MEGQPALRMGFSAAGSAAGGAGGVKRPRLAGAFAAPDEDEDGGVGKSSDRGSCSEKSAKGDPQQGKSKRSVMKQLMEQEKAKKAKLEQQASGVADSLPDGRGEEDRRDYWLRAGIVVKVMNKKVGNGKYYKKKARLRKVVERYIGEVKMLDSGDRLRIDQEDLETVSAPRLEASGRRTLFTVVPQEFSSAFFSRYPWS